MNSKIKENSVVQVNENGQKGWIGSLVQVSEVKSWGIKGYIHIPMQGDVYIRLDWDKVEYIGDAVLIHQETEK